MIPIPNGLDRLTCAVGTVGIVVLFVLALPLLAYDRWRWGSF